MNRIAVLGPKGTFTEVATKKYLASQGIKMQLEYYLSIRSTFQAIENGCAMGVIPIENTLDGFVQIILDLLTHSDLKIIHEIVLPIRFTLVANCNNIKEVTRVYTQFKAHNQCIDLIEKLGEIEIITTASNSTSYEKALNGDRNEAAIIPSHMLDKNEVFDLVVEDIADSIDNETRFIILSKELNDEDIVSVDWNTLFVVSNDVDRPGLLCEILNIFSDRGINLRSIISRPRKTGLGNYNFFIDVDGCYQRDEAVKDAVIKVTEGFDIKILGSYYRV
ncbi:prephenate dehydratase [Vallitalea guaymasensis]|uniref:Prephenate dehydratase n=1 Tax=Vallitalea guaymasensis TaxID=1185412 RepID=A0A8J8SBP5_9FIRM|nr:prephenate dehydratase domain-containing protein [Vallitalea guaymasensis]QUH28571.1 ACT domain-containing protein [Vallitalea guaymasensis]